MIRSAALSALPGIAHAHSEREDGALGPRGAPGVHAARARFAALVAGDADALVVPEQVHGDAVAVVTALERGCGHGAGPAIARTDGLVTATPGLALLVQGADCPLVAFGDDAARVAGVFHSGWRGTAARIGARAVDTAQRLGARPGKMCAAIFPGIGPCCFEVGPEVRAAFVDAFGDDAAGWFVSRDAGTDRLFLDVRAAIARTLRDAGVGVIDVVPGCTACGGNLWSHRASRGGPERHGLVVALV